MTQDDNWWHIVQTDSEFALDSVCTLGPQQIHHGEGVSVIHLERYSRCERAIVVRVDLAINS